jgi:hypothetical protein
MSLNGVGGTSAVVRDCVFRNNTGNSALAVLTMPTAEISRNTFDGNTSPQNVSALVVNNTSGATVLRHNLFAFNDATAHRYVVSWNSPGEIRGNTFYGNIVPSDGAVLNDGAVTSLARTVANNVFAMNVGGPAYRAPTSPPQASCNLFWSNPGGDYLGYVPSPTDLFVDPLFCDPTSGDFRLMSGSPCLPEDSGGCGLIGAFGDGCGTISVNPSSWGSIKNRFR